jgi:hypothetical protein
MNIGVALSHLLTPEDGIAFHGCCNFCPGVVSRSCTAVTFGPGRRSAPPTSRPAPGHGGIYNHAGFRLNRARPPSGKDGK